ncbi:hypothetical protein [Rhodococcus globerulus]|uniref:hypothetical protein n=1 Tax=Rhodococcus globerulus TaxID=33008 RepID=UPI00301A1DA1
MSAELLIAFADWLLEVGSDASLGADRSSYDNALTDTTNGLSGKAGTSAIAVSTT